MELVRVNKRTLSRFGAAALVIGLSVAGYVVINQMSRDKARAAAAAPAPAIPVTVTTAENKDVPIIVRGIGTVQAYKSVVVKARVDGQIVKVAFEEGQFVHVGDLLFQIDPKPLQAALDHAAAAKRRDEAQLRQADRLGLPVAPELRSATGHRRCADGHRRPRRGRRRDGQGQPRLYRHPRADRRPHRPAPGRSRQHDPGLIARRPRQHHRPESARDPRLARDRVRARPRSPPPLSTSRRPSRSS